MIHSKDAWAGFELDLPDGWEVKIHEGMILACPDFRSRARAVLWPLGLPGPVRPEAVANHVISLARRVNPTVQAWRAPSKENEGLELATRAIEDGVTIAGTFKITTSGDTALVAGFEGPVNALPALAPSFAQVLASFRPTAPLKRQRFLDPMERGFTAEYPEGFQARGGVQRTPPTLMPLIVFEAFEPKLQLHCGVPPSQLTFQEASPMGAFGTGFLGMMPMPGGPPTLPFMPAPVFAEKWVAPRTPHRGARIEKITDRPDLVPQMAIEWQKGGLALPLGAFSAAMLDLVFEDAGGKKRERVFVTVARPGMNMWSAQVSCTLTAPVDLWAEWAPVLGGIVQSLKVDPSWQQAENAKNAAVNQARMQDIHRRQLEIGQTIRETGDMIVKGHERRQAVQSRSVHDFCNILSGREDRVDQWGTVVSVPAGHDRYWRDGLGNVIGGSWSTNPDPNWQRLDPVPHSKL